MVGSADSLNLAVAESLLLYEVYRARTARRRGAPCLRAKSAREVPAISPAEANNPRESREHPLGNPDLTAWLLA